MLATTKQGTENAQEAFRAFFSHQRESRSAKDIEINDGQVIILRDPKSRLERIKGGAAMVAAGVALAGLLSFNFFMVVTGVAGILILRKVGR